MAKQTLVDIEKRFVAQLHDYLPRVAEHVRQGGSLRVTLYYDGERGVFKRPEALFTDKRADVV